MFIGLVALGQLWKAKEWQHKVVLWAGSPVWTIFSSLEQWQMYGFSNRKGPNRKEEFALFEERR